MLKDIFKKNKHENPIKITEKNDTSGLDATAVLPISYGRRKYDLDVKIDDYINNYFDKYDMKFKDKIRNGIETIAVWYELKYPEHELMNYFTDDKNAIEPNRKLDNIFNGINLPDEIDEEHLIKIMSLFPNKEKFRFEELYKMLPKEIKYFFSEDCGLVVVVTNGSSKTHFHIMNDGKADDIAHLLLEFSGRNMNKSVEEMKAFATMIEGKSIEEAYSIIKVNNLLSNEALKCVYQGFEKYRRIQEKDIGFLYSILYRIISRGSNIIGPRRGLLFAKEFNLNCSIPLRYGYDLLDANLKIFINECLKAGASPDTLLLDGYFRSPDYNGLKVIALDEVLRIVNGRQKIK